MSHQTPGVMEICRCWLGLVMMRSVIIGEETSLEEPILSFVCGVMLLSSRGQDKQPSIIYGTHQCVAHFLWSSGIATADTRHGMLNPSADTIPHCPARLLPTLRGLGT